MSDNYGSDENQDFGDGYDEPASFDSNASRDYSGDSDNEDVDELSNQELEEDEEAIDEGLEEMNYQILEQQNKYDKPNQHKITSPFMTKFQKAKILGVRAVQISKNAPLYLNNENIANMNWDPLSIAQKQLSDNKIPFIIRRFLPDGKFQDWKVSQLKSFD